ncbi:hypothetical protein JZ751_021827, partial [Albula glossodonta]
EDEKAAGTPSSTAQLLKWLNCRKVRSFYTPITGDSLREGTRNLLQATGLGKLKPNTLIMGFKTNWQQCSPYSLQDYITTLYTAWMHSAMSECITMATFVIIFFLSSLQLGYLPNIITVSARSLPVPQTDCPSGLYMAWLDTLSYGLHCPVLLIRGNQQNVLTFYCQ